MVPGHMLVVSKGSLAATLRELWSKRGPHITADVFMLSHGYGPTFTPVFDAAAAAGPAHVCVTRPAASFHGLMDLSWLN